MPEHYQDVCGGGRGKIQYSALWMYDKLVSCQSVGQLEFAKDLKWMSMMFIT
jgi:hypothetical protein